MYYTGIDLHRKTSFLTTVDSIGQIVKKANVANQESTILEYFLTLDDDTQVVIESTANWYWLYDLLTEHGMGVVISNPVKTKAIASARIKNDKLDSHMLAQLLRTNLLATVHVSSQQTRQLKELLHHRSKSRHSTIKKPYSQHYGQEQFYCADQRSVRQTRSCIFITSTISIVSAPSGGHLF